MVSRIVSSPLAIKRTLRLVFQHAVNSVNPYTLIENVIKSTGSDIKIGDKTYSLNNNLYLVGFGKAVFGMAHQVELKLGRHLQGGIISIPVGQKEVFSQFKFMEGGVIKIFEGAKDNIPDENSEKAAKHIAELVKSLGKDDVLIVLVSGGGSALLPLPVPPVTLHDKATVIKLLARQGADITELNCIRKRLSLLKGGGLLHLAYPAKVISFILSDIVGDPLDLIASGPTVPNNDDPKKPKMIFEKYSLLDKIPVSVKQMIEQPLKEDIKGDVQNILLGSNKIALEAALSDVKKYNYKAVILTEVLEGLVSELYSSYIELVVCICQVLSNRLESKSDFEDKMEKIKCQLKIADASFSELLCIIHDFKDEKLCLLFGGEPTVKVKGEGKGGRSQQLVLQFSDALNKASKDNPLLGNFNIGFLCGGTDGIDGPTDAAGAMAYSGQMRLAMLQNLDPKKYIENCDSYTFFRKLNNGEDILKIGHTGTNVMDIHILLIEVK
ncbi:glycerate kinase [Lycorma delicatula]|uniref:glycerate kinase n=1 Tax=Lycorma delicatula TaxID=130591 RepID=UPI003F514CC5